jgi:hypothetical protein
MRQNPVRVGVNIAFAVSHKTDRRNSQFIGQRKCQIGRGGFGQQDAYSDFSGF